MELTSNAQLSEFLSNMVICQTRMSNEIYSAIMAFVLSKDVENSECLDKWISNCDKLMRKLSETK